MDKFLTLSQYDNYNLSSFSHLYYTLIQYILVAIPPTDKSVGFLATIFIEKYSDTWWEAGFADIGLTVHPFVKLWVEGFNLALEQLERAGEQSHEYSN